MTGCGWRAKSGLTMRNRQHLASVGRGNRDEIAEASSSLPPSSGSSASAVAQEPSRDPIYSLSAAQLEQTAKAMNTLGRLVLDYEQELRELAAELRKLA